MKRDGASTTNCWHLTCNEITNQIKLLRYSPQCDAALYTARVFRTCDTRSRLCFITLIRPAPGDSGEILSPASIFKFKFKLTIKPSGKAFRHLKVSLSKPHRSTLHIYFLLVLSTAIHWLMCGGGGSRFIFTFLCLLRISDSGVYMRLYVRV